MRVKRRAFLQRRELVLLRIAPFLAGILFAFSITLVTKARWALWARTGSASARGIMWLRWRSLVPNDNKEVKEMAEFDAWYVFGVDKVVNKLAVER